MPKKVSKKLKDKAPAPAGGDTILRLARAREVASRVTRDMKGRGYVAVGADIKELEYDHVPTGNPAIDYVTNGGLVRGRMTEFWGREGNCKTTAVAHVIRSFQRRGMICALAAVEALDKGWWRTIGVFIPYSLEELAEMDETTRAAATEYNKTDLPPLTVIQHESGDFALEGVVRLVRENVYDLIAVDSLGAVRSSAAEEKPITEASSYGGEAPLFTRFVNALYSALNTRYDEEGNPQGGGPVANRTIILCINQARQTIGTQAHSEHKKFHPTGGQALKHAWSQSLFFWEVEDFSDMVRYDRFTRRNVYAKMFGIYGYKMRGAPEGREARFTLHLQDHEHDGTAWKSGQIDRAGTVRALAIMLGVVQQAGASYSYAGIKWRGKEALEADLRADPAFYEELCQAVLQKAAKDSRTGFVPVMDD